MVAKVTEHLLYVQGQRLSDKHAVESEPYCRLSGLSEDVPVFKMSLTHNSDADFGRVVLNFNKITSRIV